jgi:predicted dehydrogenase
MNLKPEEKEIGKENFYSVIGSEHIRRDFLKQSIAAALIGGGSLGAFYYKYQEVKGNPLRVGFVGVGDEGNVLLGAVNKEYLQVAAICDIRPFSIHRAFYGDVASEKANKARPGLLKTHGWKTREEAEKHVKVYQDYKELLADKDIEAIVIGLPLHLHAPVAIEAMKAGKHVLTEKLMAKTVTECKAMARAAAETGKILAVGHQRHYNILYDNAVETIKKGLLGDLHYIRAQWHRTNQPGRDSWQMPLPPGVRGDDTRLEKQLKKLNDELDKLNKGKEDPAKIKKIVDLQKQIAQVQAQILDKTVDAAKYGYEPKKIVAGDKSYEASALEELIRWRLWNRTGGGLMVELGSHQLDAASIFIAAVHGGVKQHPLSVSAMSNRNLFGLDREIEDHIYCMIDFPAPGYNPKDPLGKLRKIAVQYASINGNGFGGYGEIVFGTKGTLILEQEEDVMLFKDADTSSKIGVSKGKDGAPTLDTQASGGPAKAVAAAAVGDVSRGYTEELEHWAWCIRNPDPKNKPRCTPEIALGDAVIALTTNVAARNGLRVDFKESWFDVKDPAAPETDPEIEAQIKARNA